MGRFQDLQAALTEQLGVGRDLYPALHDAGAATLADDASLADQAARIAIALARDFERDHGCAIGRDPVVFTRLVEASVRLIHELRSVASTEVSLPFLVAVPSVMHLQRTLTGAQLAELAARDPTAPGPAPAAAPELEEPPKKKRGWWPF